MSPGNRFGGFTNLSWDSSGSGKGHDNNAFLFSLNKNMKLTCNNQNCVIYCSKSFGPRFGGNSDILITGNHINCFSQIPSSFGVNEGVHPYFLTDMHKFDVKEVECFHVEYI